MRTADLITLLSQDAPRPVAWWRRAGPILGAGLVVSVLLFSLILQPRDDLASSAGLLATAAKWLAAALVAGLAGLAAAALRRPDGSADALVKLAFAVPLVAALVIGADLVINGTQDLGARALGSSAAACLVSVGSLSLPILAASLIVLRAGAVTAPGRAGLASGLAAAALAAAIYAVHCNEDSPLFVAAWYGLAVILVGGLGAILGRLALRW